MDEFEERLDAAGRTAADDEGVRAALAELAAAHAPKRRVSKPVAIGLGMGAVLALGGAGVAVAGAAYNWGQPWTVTADVDVIRAWHDVNRVYLGTCETHIYVHDLSAENKEALLDSVEKLDTATLAPIPAIVAAELFGMGRLEEMPRLIDGGKADLAYYKVSMRDDIAPGSMFSDSSVMSDARILQDGLVEAIEQAEGPWADAHLGAGNYSIGNELQTQCTTDPVVPSSGPAAPIPSWTPSDDASVPSEPTEAPAP